MDPPRFQRGATTSEEIKSDPPVPQGEDTRFPPRKSTVWITTSHSCALVDKRKKDFTPQRKEISTNVLTYTTTEPTHKI